MNEARMPVIKHFDGNCHVFVDASAELAMAIDIVVNPLTPEIIRMRPSWTKSFFIGKIGREAFQLIVNHPKLRKIPMILETPKEGPDGNPTPTTDRHNLELLRKLAGQA
jgi:hypothetical protein